MKTEVKEEEGLQFPGEFNALGRMRMFEVSIEKRELWAPLSNNRIEVGMERMPTSVSFRTPRDKLPFLTIVEADAKGVVAECIYDYHSYFFSSYDPSFYGIQKGKEGKDLGVRLVGEERRLIAGDGCLFSEMEDKRIPKK